MTGDRPPKGQRDYRQAILTRHALDRFVERFGAAGLEQADEELRAALSRTRRLGRNAENGAIAVLALHQGKVLVAILREPDNAPPSCLTVLTWPQFEPRLPEFGRGRMPRKRGRMLRRLIDPD
ncbi:hypothetical protein BH23PLA1_BH23PLA1_36410 [soil metagenome]